MDKPKTLDRNCVWRHTISGPLAYNYFPDGMTQRTGPDGKQISGPGCAKIRTRYDDLTGLTVFHCHMLAHEDRGMMQLVQIVPGKTLAGHHHYVFAVRCAARSIEFMQPSKYARPTLGRNSPPGPTPRLVSGAPGI